jgi:hypothetical protein
LTRPLIHLFLLHPLLLKMSFIHTHCHFKHPWRLHRLPEDHHHRHHLAKLLKQTNRCIENCKITIRTANIISLFAVTLENGYLNTQECRIQSKGQSGSIQISPCFFRSSYVFRLYTLPSSSSSSSMVSCSNISWRPSCFNFSATTWERHNISKFAQ